MATPSSIPPQIQSALEAIIRRIRSMLLLKGVLATLAAALISLLVIMSIDWAFDLQNRVLRVLVTGTALTVTLVVAWRFLVRPLTRRLALPLVARWLEEHHPEIQERISTAVTLAQRNEGVSESFIKQIVEQASLDATKIDPKKELTSKAARKPLFSAIGGCVALLGLFAAAPSVFPVLIKRAVTPFADVGNIYAASIQFLTPDQQTVAMHDAFPIEALYTASKEQRAVVVLTYPDGTEVREQMNEDATISTSQLNQHGIRHSLPTSPPAKTP